MEDKEFEPLQCRKLNLFRQAFSILAVLGSGRGVVQRESVVEESYRDNHFRNSEFDSILYRGDLISLCYPEDVKPIRFVFLLLFVFVTITLAGESPRPFLQIGEVVQGWSADQHLWTKGSLNLPEARLAELEKWLDEKAPNWTVVLMSDAQGQGFESHRGVRAVEHALGKGLPNQTGFGNLVDSRTGQANGAIFALFLAERKFSYFASEAHDSRRLGERYWVGRLDQPAVRAMRSGGRIVDAVKDTISSIESSLSRSISEEENRKRLAEVARQKAIEEAKGYPQLLDNEISAVKDQVAKLRSNHPNLIGPVIQPDLASWNATRDMIARLAEQGDTKNARRHFSDTLELIRAFQTGLREWEQAPEVISDLGSQIDSHPLPANAPVVDGFLAEARLALDSAKENHEIGELLYANQVSEAERGLSNARLAYRDWSESERRKQQIQIGVTCLVALSLLIFLIVSNRMRRPAMKESRKLLNYWKEELRGKFDTLFSLMDRAGVVVGSRSDLLSSGLDGTTREVGLRTIRSVDELFIMSAATDQVMKQVEQLLDPATFGLRLHNRFSSRRYQKAIDLLESEPIGFDQEDHLEAILSPDANQSGIDRPTSKLLLGDAKDYEPFRISFEKLILEYDERQEQVEEDLSRLEAGIDGFPLSLQRLWGEESELRGLTDRLALQAGEDTLFPLQSFRETLLPKLSQNLDDLGLLGDTDPLLAFESNLPDSTRLISEAKALAHHVESFRALDLPAILENRKELQAIDRKVGWIGEAFAEANQRSENLAQQIYEESIAASLADFRDDMIRLKGRTISSLAMAHQVEEEIRPRITETGIAISDAKADLATSLGLSPDRLLEEPNLSPGDQVDRASQGVETALSSIDHGEAEAAQAALADVEKCLDDASLMIRMSRRCLEEHGERIQALETFRENLVEEVTETSPLLEELQSDYASSVLLFSSRFGEEIEGQQSIANCIERANRRLDQGKKDMDESREAFQEGALIRAAGLLEAIANELGFARHQLELVRDQHRALRETEKENEESEQELVLSLREIRITGEDRRTGPVTLASLEKASSEVEQFAADRKMEAPDPFLLSFQADELKGLLRSAEDGIKADWEAHELADSTATGARAGLTFCHTYLREAHQDGVPDSRALTRAIQRHEELTQELDRLNAILDSPHQDWGKVFEQVNEVIGETSKVRATLEEELKAAREAVAQLKSAASSLRSLQNWRSSHRVRINRRAGNTHLLEAKQALALGNYVSARTSAVRASGEALRELKKARTREARAVSAAAAARRAAMFSSSTSSSSSSFSSSFGGGSSFSSSSGSGFSSSSFSSGSGFSSSGW